MKKANYSTIWLIILSAILITVLFNLKLYWFVLNLLESGQLFDPAKGGLKQIEFGLFISLYHFLLFCILAFFNYSWKEKLGLNNLPKFLSILLVVLANIAIYLAVSYWEHWWFGNNFDFRGKEFPPFYFMTSNFPLAILGIAEAYILVLLKKVKTSELEKNQLREQKTNAELAALKDQISPHFFFNTLSSLSTVVRNDKKEVALEFIQEMSNTYRYTLASKQQDLVSLQEELDFVKSYLFLLKKRFGDKLSAAIEVPAKATQRKIPPMSLQILVENVVQHNVMTQASPMSIHFFIENDWIVVENNFQEKAQSNGLGLGLENLSNRYRLLAQKDIIIEREEDFFRVKLPLL